MTTTVNEQSLSTPSALDLGVSQINAKLSSGLSWLTNAYGVSEKRERVDDGSPIQYPAIYGSNNEYVDLRPDSHLGNFCFWILPEYNPTFDPGGNLLSETGSFSVVFWFDYRLVFTSGADESNNIRNVIEQIYPILIGGGFSNIAIQVQQVVTRSELIYSGYTVPAEVRDQYLMRPYGGLRIDGIFKTRITNC